MEPEPDGDGAAGSLVVVVPAHNEAGRLESCLSSLRGQGQLRVYFSDNASTDATAQTARQASAGLEAEVRTVEELPPAAHFVSAGRWALTREPSAEFFAFLAADDQWGPGFAHSCLQSLVAHPDAGAAYPAFEWIGGGPGRRIRPTSFRGHIGALRQMHGLALPDWRELSNLMYGVFRRQAFMDLLVAVERGGDEFGVDFAAVWCVLGRHTVLACPGALGLRSVRPDADLLARAGFRREEVSGPVGMIRTYVRLNVRINSLIARALARAAGDRAEPPAPWMVQLARLPQWVVGAGRHAAAQFRAGWASVASEGATHGSPGPHGHQDESRDYTGRGR